MLRARAIPCLLLKGDGLVNTERFKEPKHVGDSINAARRPFSNCMQACTPVSYRAAASIRWFS